jgi:peptidoglycan hydrolase CwlO-like protein
MDPLSIVALCVSGVMMVIAIVTFIVNSVKDAKKNAASFTEISFTLQQLVTTTNDIKEKVEKMNESLNKHSKDIAVLQRDLQTAFIRIDELRDMIKSLQKGE